MIPEPVDHIARRLQLRRARRIRPFIMLPAIDFDDEATFGAEEIHYKRPDRRLAPELEAFKMAIAQDGP